MDTTSGQPLVAETLARMDEGWSAFHRRIHSLPGQAIEQHLGQGSWTRKQMLAHVAAWHELTTDRLARFVQSGEPGPDPEDGNGFNDRAARAAIGRTSGEILLALDESYRRLRREVARLTEVQITANEDWAAAIIAGNTYSHYSEHLADLTG